MPTTTQKTIEELEQGVAAAVDTLRAFRQGDSNTTDARAALQTLSAYVRAREKAAREKRRELRKQSRPRVDYELEVLQTTVYGTQTKAETLNALIREKYEAVTRDRCKLLPAEAA